MPGYLPKPCESLFDEFKARGWGFVLRTPSPNQTLEFPGAHMWQRAEDSRGPGRGCSGVLSGGRQAAFLKGSEAGRRRARISRRSR